MSAKFILKTALFLMLCPLSWTAVAETNVAGDEIIILGDYPAMTGLNASLSSFGPSLLPDPIISYLPDSAFENVDEDADPQVVDNLWQRIRNGYGMPELESEYTAKHESWYASRPDY
ncbi:MAG TPA: lytic transglycosylase, partial [Methylophilaceae bacterium]|nr:lytic transglycosylase [Methylophilaceae bacterium]